MAFKLLFHRRPIINLEFPKSYPVKPVPQRRLGIAGSYEEVIGVIRGNFPLYSFDRSKLAHPSHRSTPSYGLIRALVEYICVMCNEYDIDAVAAHMAKHGMIHPEDNPEIYIDPNPEF
jgi:hypothetical protein